MRLVVGQKTDVGRVREGNEDGVLVNDDIGLFAVADGMGGHVAGEVASATALEALRAAVTSGKAIRDAITEANDAVVERSLADPNLSGMGTTMTAGTHAAGDTLLVGHVGDSRAYLARDGELRQITEDHSLVEEMVRGGQLTPEQAEVHPQRSTITRALGIDADVNVDVYPVELQDGDRVLMCSDGLTGMVRADDILAILEREPDPQRAADRLIDAANAAGGEDNITALVIDAVADGAAGGVATPAPARPAEAPPAAAPSRRKKRGWSLLRVAIWVLPVLAVLAIAVGAVGWYARRTYFVEITDNCRTNVTTTTSARSEGPPGSCVTLFKGVPDGLLGWDPTVEQNRADIDTAELTEAQVNDLEGGKRFSSKDDAENFLAGLAESTATTTTTTSTTTTAPLTTVPLTPA